jgi:hypothetical protein
MELAEIADMKPPRGLVSSWRLFSYDAQFHPSYTRIIKKRVLIKSNAG